MRRNDGKPQRWNWRSKWCLMRSSEKLRLILETTIKSGGYKPYRLARLAGIPDRSKLNDFLKGDNKAITQWQLLKVAEQVGIEIKLDIKFKE